MNKDIRLDVDFWDHPKTEALVKALGVYAPVSLQRLWCWAAKYKPNGILSGMDAKDIERAAKWRGKRRSSGALVTHLLALRFLDERDGTFAIHDWADWNGWALHAHERSALGRKAASARWTGDAHHADTNGTSVGHHADIVRTPVGHHADIVRTLKPLEPAPILNSGYAPSPSPYPSPKPIPIPSPSPYPPQPQNGQSADIKTPEKRAITENDTCGTHADSIQKDANKEEEKIISSLLTPELSTWCQENNMAWGEAFTRPKAQDYLAYCRKKVIAPDLRGFQR
jgi:hypothetical protein